MASDSISSTCTTGSHFQITHWARSLKDIFDPHSDLKDVESGVFETMGNQKWEICMSPLVIWEDGVHENAKCGRHWIYSPCGNKVAADRHLSLDSKYVGLWLRNLDSDKIGISNTEKRVMKYVLSLRTDSGKVIALNQDLWIPFLYQNQLRGTYWFCSHADILQAIFGTPYCELIDKCCLEKKLFICIEWHLEASSHIPYPFKTLSTTDPRYMVWISLRGEKLRMHEALIRCSVVLSADLERITFDMATREQVRAKTGRMVTLPQRDGIMISLDKYLTLRTSSQNCLKTFAQLVNEPTQCIISTASVDILADLLTLSYNVKLAVVCSTVIDVIRARCSHFSDLLRFDELLGPLMPWKMILWSELSLICRNYVCVSQKSRFFLRWVSSLAVREPISNLQKFFRRRHRSYHPSYREKDLLRQTSEHTKIALTNCIAASYLRQWATFIVGFDRSTQPGCDEVLGTAVCRGDPPPVA